MKTLKKVAFIVFMVLLLLWDLFWGWVGLHAY